MKLSLNANRLIVNLTKRYMKVIKKMEKFKNYLKRSNNYKMSWDNLINKSKS